MNLLYHFTNYKVALEHILPNLELRANILLHTNDPRETHLCAFQSRNIPYDILFPELTDNIARMFCLGRYIKSQVQVICFSYGEKFWNNEMMWAHYAGNHTGVCLAIDESSFIEENQNILTEDDRIWDVSYKHIDKPSFNWDGNKSDKENFSFFIKSNKKYLFLNKSEYWDKEKEKRFLFFKEEQLKYFSIKNCLKEVYLGIYFPTSYIPLINHFLKDKNIELYDCTFGLDKPMMGREKRSDDNKKLVDLHYLELCEKNHKPRLDEKN